MLKRKFTGSRIVSGDKSQALRAEVIFLVLLEKKST